MSRGLVSLHNLEVQGGDLSSNATLAIDESIDYFLKAVLVPNAVQVDQKQYHRWIANIGFALFLKGHSNAAAGLINFALMLNPLDNWLWQRAAACFGSHFVQQRCKWQPHMFFNAHVIHGKFYTQQLDVAEAILYMSHLHQHTPTMLPNEETPGVNIIIAMLNFLRQKPIDEALQSRSDKAAVEHVALQYYNEVDAAGGGHLHTKWTHRQRIELEKRHPSALKGESLAANKLKRRIENMTLCESSPLYSPALNSWSQGMLLMRAGFYREAVWYFSAAYRLASEKVHQLVESNASQLGDASDTLRIVNASLRWSSNIAAAHFENSFAGIHYPEQFAAAVAVASRVPKFSPTAGDTVTVDRNLLAHRYRDLQRVMRRYREICRSARNSWRAMEMSASAPRMIVGWVPDVGIGNQMLAITSYLLLGVVSSRPVALYWMPGMEHNKARFERAFSLDERLLPDFMSVALQSAPVGTDSAAPGESVVWDPHQLQLRSEVLSFGERRRKVDLQLSRALILDDFERSFSDIDVLHIVSNQPLWRFLEQNPVYSDKIQKIFNNDVYGELLPHFLHPSGRAATEFIDLLKDEPLLAGIVNEAADDGQDTVDVIRPPPLSQVTASSEPASSPLIIGVHIRFGMDFYNDHYDPRTGDANLDDSVDGVVTCAKLSIQRHLSAAALLDGTSVLRPVLVYLAADNPKAKVRLHAYFSVSYHFSVVSFGMLWCLVCIRL